MCGPIDLCAMFCGVCLWYVLVCLSASCHFLSHNCRRPYRPDLPLTIPCHTILAWSPPKPHQAWLLRYKSQICVLANYCNVELVQRCPRIILQKTAFSLVKSRLVLRSPDCLGVRSSKCKNGLKHNRMVVDCALVIKAMTRPDQYPHINKERGIICPVSLLYSWHWVLLERADNIWTTNSLQHVMANKIIILY